MTDTAARYRNITGTTAQWAANDRVLGNGEFGVETPVSGDQKAKLGDGVKKWSELPYYGGEASGISTAVQDALDLKLSLSGGDMTGNMHLVGDGTDPLHPVTKQQLDADYSDLSTSLTLKLDVGGGTLTGYLTAHANPSSPMHVATKAYVDTADALKASKAGDTFTGQVTLPGSPTDPKHAVPKEFVESGSWAVAVGGTSGQAGKGIRLNGAGLIDSSMLPISGSYLGPIDLTATYALSGSFGVGSYYALSDSGTIDGSWSSHLNGSPTTGDAGQFIIYNANGKWDLIGDTASSGAIAGKVDRAGDTMTGDLTLVGAPTTSLMAATKAYVDLHLLLSGGTMTGPITLSGAPTNPDHAATKDYVDDGDALSLQIADNLSDLASPSTALNNLGGSTLGKTLFAIASAALARAAIGATAIGEALMTAANAAAGRTAIGAAASGSNTDITSLTLANTGLQIADTNASHNLTIAPGSNITANRTLTITTGDANRTIDISAGSLAPTTAGLALIAAADAAAERTAMGLGSASLLAETTTAEFRANTADRALSTDQVWAAGVEVALTDAATIAVDMATFINASVTLGGNRALGAPTNTKTQSGRIRIIQDGTGGRTMTFNAVWKFENATDAVLSTAAGAVDVLYYDVVNSTYIVTSVMKNVG